MSCSNPLTKFRLSDGSLVWTEQAGDDVTGVLFLGCGKCALCRTSKAAEWSTRMVLESYCHRDSIAVTLTYDDASLPPAGSLCKVHVQSFQKRLREYAWRVLGVRVRFSSLGEYSPERLRPHYHVCVYGLLPPDLVRIEASQVGNPQFASDVLTRLWGMGRVTFQLFTPEAASYIARHDAWKLTGDAHRDAHAVFDAQGSLVGHREPEFLLCSRDPGIGSDYLDKYGPQCLRSGFVVVDGRQVPVPTFLLDKGESRWPDVVSELRAQREFEAVQRMPDETRERLGVRELCARARVALKRRDGVK